MNLRFKRFPQVFAHALCLYFLVFTANGHANIRSGLVGWWKLDEGTGISAADSSGNANTGTLEASAGLPTWVEGKRRLAVQFDGTNDKISVNDAATLDLTDFTISMWFMRLGNGTVGGFAGCATNGVEFLTSKGLGGGDNTGIDCSWALGVVQSTKKLIGCFEGTTGADYILAQGATVLSNNVWYHVAFTHTAANTIIYLNGVSDTSTGATANPANNNIKVGIGYGTEGAASTYDGGINGIIDDVRIFSRALTSTEVGELYAAGIVINNAAINDAVINN